MTTRRFGLLYHFTPIENVPRILAQGALLNDNTVQEQDLLVVEAGEKCIKGQRRRRAVPCPPGGVVADYVPFYFAARSPMMGTISRGNVPTFKGDHRDLVYFVTDVVHAVATGHPVVVSNRNAALAWAKFSDDLGVLGDLDAQSPTSDFIDWPLMKQRMWNPTPEDPDRMERRMAELLVHQQLPLDALVGIAVQKEENCERIKGWLRESSGPPTFVAVRPEWYF